MMKHYKLFILLFFCSLGYSQQVLQDLYVSKAYVGVNDEWSQANYGSKILINANTDGKIKITNYEFLNDFTDGKAKLQDVGGLNSAEFSYPQKVKTKTDQKGITNITFEGVFIFQLVNSVYSVSSRVTMLVYQDDIVGLKIKENGRSKEYAFSLAQD